MEKNSIKLISLRIGSESWGPGEIGLICVNGQARVKKVGHYFLLKELVEEWLDEHESDSDTEYLTS
jgi:hypothetical protein